MSFVPPQHLFGDGYDSSTTYIGNDTTNLGNTFFNTDPVLNSITLPQFGNRVLQAYAPLGFNVNNSFFKEFLRDMFFPIGKIFTVDPVSWWKTNNYYINDQTYFEGNLQLHMGGFSAEMILNDFELFQKINNLTSSKSDLDLKLSSLLQQYISSQTFSVKSVNSTHASGLFNGIIGSVNGEFYNGTFSFMDTSFTSSNGYYLEDNSSITVQYLNLTNAGNINFYNVSYPTGNTTNTDRYFSFTASKAVVQIDLEDNSSDLNFNANGTVGFVGSGGYAIEYTTFFDPSNNRFSFDSPGGILLLFGSIIVIIMLIAYCASRREKTPSTNTPSPIELAALNRRKDIAQKFVNAYQPDSEAGVLALNASNAIPVSMEGQENVPTLLLIRQFDDYQFDRLPTVEISKIDEETGTQLVEFSTSTECSIQTNACMKAHILDNDGPQPPPAFDHLNASPECYFEVKVVSIESANLGIGFASCPYPPFRLPGFAETSIGYHSKSGKVYISDYDEQGNDCGEPLVEGDVLGIGYRMVEVERVGEHVLTQTVFFFSRNGTRMGDEFVTDGFFSDKIYPTIGSTGKCVLEVTFGKLQDVFDLPTEFKVNVSEEGSLSPEDQVQEMVIDVQPEATIS
ncbi:Rsp5p-dependent ubiquitination, sorting of cargo proteins at the multivesicular body [Boothiomyces macroporosus]|uniref:Rsp5p-dependent ubiquitination, sorting of cargo proteins at the multivesicular body n=1 Tax=Boothiomyces macroporosus TaxID=261099 RepID=A0AAD5Y459_9FUNG|nr:Rsp5p-dependent ubiquitination, sorting of cargo proteins at the multivesicular body [Boothiomyces macroporosus]